MNLCILQPLCCSGRYKIVLLDIEQPRYLIGAISDLIGNTVALCRSLSSNYIVWSDTVQRLRGYIVDSDAAVVFSEILDWATRGCLLKSTGYPVTFTVSPGPVRCYECPGKLGVYSQHPTLTINKFECSQVGRYQLMLKLSEDGR